MDSRLIDSIILGNRDLAEMEFQDAMRDRVAAAFEVRKVELASGLLPSDELNEGMYDFSLDAYNGMPYEVWKMYKDYNVKQGGRIRIHTPDEMEWHGKTAVVRDVSNGLVHVQLDDTGRKLALTPNQLKPITMNEARMPLEGHPYHDKSDDALRYIIKDAGEAAKAMRDVNPAAEGKYLDQVNDASTVLNYRKRSAGRAVTEALSPKTNAAYGEYEDEEALRAYRDSDTCPSCEGEGNHGYEEESGKEHTCFACGGTGKYFSNGRKVSEAYNKDAVNKAIASSNRSGRKIGGKEAKAIHRLLRGRHEESTPDLAIRTTYTQTYAKHAKTALDAKAAMNMAYDEVENQHGPEALKALKSYHTNNMQKESMDKVGKEDKDIDNDGDHDKTDKYLHNRRKAIGRAIAKKKMNEAEQMNEISKGAAIRAAGVAGGSNDRRTYRIINRIEKKFGREVADHAVAHVDAQYSGREGKSRGTDPLNSVLDRPAQRRITKAGNLNKQDQKELASAIQNRMKMHGGKYQRKKPIPEEFEQMDEFAPLAALALRAAPMLARAAPTIAGAAQRKAVATAAEKGMGTTSQKIIGSLVRRGTSGAVKKTASAIERKASQSQQQNEMAPSGAKYERMVKHIKAKYAKGGLTDQEKSVAYATAWKAKRAADDE